MESSNLKTKERRADKSSEVLREVKKKTRAQYYEGQIKKIHQELCQNVAGTSSKMKMKTAPGDLCDVSEKLRRKKPK